MVKYGIIDYYGNMWLHASPGSPGAPWGPLGPQSHRSRDARDAKQALQGEEGVVHVATTPWQTAWATWGTETYKLEVPELEAMAHLVWRFYLFKINVFSIVFFHSYVTVPKPKCHESGNW